MRYFTYVLLFFLVATSCKPKKNIVEVVEIKNLSARKIIKNHESNAFSAKTLDARLKISYSDNRKDKKNKVNISARLRILKDSIIWIKGTKVVSAFRIKITPSTFSYYSPIEKEYFEGDYSFLRELLGTEVDFQQLQNLLLGQSILNLKDQRYSSKVEENTYKLTPKKQKELYRIFFFFHPDHFKLKRQLLKINDDTQTLRVEYDSYTSKDNQLIPKRILVNANEKEKYTNIDIYFKSFELNKLLKTPYRIPRGYKKMKF